MRAEQTINNKKKRVAPCLLLLSVVYHYILRPEDSIEYSTLTNPTIRSCHQPYDQKVVRPHWFPASGFSGFHFFSMWACSFWKSYNIFIPLQLPTQLAPHHLSSTVDWALVTAL